MWVTCYTDASHARKTGATWAVWLRASEGRLVRAGRCPPWVRDSVGAELAAIYAGVHLAVTRFGARGVFVRSDCQGALELARADARRSKRRDLARLQARIAELVKERSVELDLRWTPGHRPLREGTAAFLNRACDRLAGRLRRGAKK